MCCAVLCCAVLCSALVELILMSTCRSLSGDAAPSFPNFVLNQHSNRWKRGDWTGERHMTHVYAGMVLVACVWRM